MVSRDDRSLPPVTAPGQPDRAAWVMAVAFLVAFGVGAAVPAFAALLRVWGRFIPQAHIQADYLFGLVWAVVLGLGVLFLPVASRDKLPLLVLWAAKCFVTLGFMLLYEWLYSLDAYGYFLASRIRPPLESLDWWTSGRGSMLIVVAWIQTSLLPDSYHALKVSFAMIGLIAVYLFYRGAVMFLGREEPRLLYVLGLYLSILFWSSILGKDPVQFLGVALYVYGVIGLERTRRWRYLVPLGAGILLALSVRFWAGPILLLPLYVFFVFRARGTAARLAVLSIGVLGLGFVLDRFTDRLGLAALTDFYALAQTVGIGWEGGSGQQQPMQFTGLRSVLVFLPKGAFTALFRPLPGEVMNPFGLLAGLENLFLVVVLWLAILRTKLDVFRDPLVIWAALLVATWAGLYGFISYYNLGSAVRFKLQILPILLGVLLFVSQKPKALIRGDESSRSSSHPDE